MSVRISQYSTVRAVLRLVFLNILLVYIVVGLLLWGVVMGLEYLGLFVHALWAHIICSTVQYILTLHIISQWTHNYYELTPTHLRHWKGVFYPRKRSYPLVDIQEIEVKKRWIDRLIGSGTLMLRCKNPKREVRIRYLCCPTQYAHMIQKSIADQYERAHTPKNQARIPELIKKKIAGKTEESLS